MAWRLGPAAGGPPRSLLAPVPIAQKHRNEIAHFHRKETARTARSGTSYLRLSLEVAA